MLRIMRNFPLHIILTFLLIGFNLNLLSQEQSSFYPIDYTDFNNDQNGRLFYDFINEEQECKDRFNSKIIDNDSLQNSLYGINAKFHILLGKALSEASDTNIIKAIMGRIYSYNISNNLFFSNDDKFKFLLAESRRIIGHFPSYTLFFNNKVESIDKMFGSMLIDLKWQADSLEIRGQDNELFYIAILEAFFSGYEQLNYKELALQIDLHAYELCNKRNVDYFAYTARTNLCKEYELMIMSYYRAKAWKHDNLQCLSNSARGMMHARRYFDSYLKLRLEHRSNIALMPSGYMSIYYELLELYSKEYLIYVESLTLPKEEKDKHLNEDFSDFFSVLDSHLSYVDSLLGVQNIDFFQLLLAKAKYMKINNISTLCYNLSNEDDKDMFNLCKESDRSWNFIIKKPYLTYQKFLRLNKGCLSRSSIFRDALDILDDIAESDARYLGSYSSNLFSDIIRYGANQGDSIFNARILAKIISIDSRYSANLLTEYYYAIDPTKRSTRHLQDSLGNITMANISSDIMKTRIIMQQDWYDSFNAFEVDPTEEECKELIKISNQYLPLLNHYFSNKINLMSESELVDMYNDKELYQGSYLEALQRLKKSSANHIPFIDYCLNSTNLFYLLHQRDENSKELAFYKNQIVKYKSSLDSVVKYNYLINQYLLWENTSHQDKNLSLTVKDIQSNISKNEVVIQFIKYNNYSRKRFMTENYATIIIKKNSPPEIVVYNNGIDYQLDTSFILTKNKIDNQWYSDYSNDMDATLKDVNSYNVYWKPIHKTIEDFEKIYVINDGVFNNINLNTLFNPVTNKYLIQELDITLLHSSKELLDKSMEYKNTDAVLFGDVAFDYTPTHSNNLSALHRGIQYDDETRGGYMPLPATAIEVEYISELLKIKGWSIKQFIQKEASEYNLKNVSSPRVLHIATHGDFQAEKTDKKLGFFFESGLLSSWLCLTGANNQIRLKNNHPDGGVFTAYEASLLNLKNTELVVLSACNTGKGVVNNGNGVMGLQRGFFYAGTKKIIMSLWKVGDKSTQFFMQLFYSNWLEKKMTIKEAFRKAQFEMMEDPEYNHPKYWGAFVLIGK